MAEQIILDPAEEVNGRTEVDITPVMKPEGVQWPPTTNSPYYADGDVGQVVIDERWNNREVPIPLVLKDTAGTVFATWRSLLQQKAAEFQGGRGGVIKRVTNGGTAYADIISARFTAGGDWAQAHKDYDTNSLLELVLSPESYGEWRTLDVMPGTGEIVGVLQEAGRDAVIEGNFPPGNRCRIIVTDTSGNDQRSVLTALRARSYSGSATAALSYEAEMLTRLDDTVLARSAGASSGTAVQHNGMATSWTPVLSTTLATGDPATHVGRYRVRVRATSQGGTAVALRLAWGVGHLNNPTLNPGVAFPSAARFSELDLGQVFLAGDDDHWVGHIQALGMQGGETVQIDKVFYEPVDEHWAHATATLEDAPGVNAFLARDEFRQAAGTLTGNALPFGGRWASAGDATDANLTGGGAITRAATSDTDYRFMLAGTVAPSAVVVQATASLDTYVSGASVGVFARYVDVSNWAGVKIGGDSNGRGIATFQPAVKIAGVEGNLEASFSDPNAARGFAFGSEYTIRFLVATSGVWALWLGASQENLSLVAAGYDANVGPGSALDDGRVGILDRNLTATAQTRTYLDFAAWAPNLDAVIYGRGSAEFSTDSLPIGTIGSVPRLPVDGPVELLVRNSRGDLTYISDPGPDGFTAQAFYRPCWLNVPDAS